MELDEKSKDINEQFKKQLDEAMSDEEAIKILRSMQIFLSLPRKSGKLKAYIALYKAYYALEEKVKNKEEV